MAAIILSELYSSESLAWHYHDIFWAGAKTRLSDFANEHDLNGMVRLFDIIIEFSGAEEPTTTELNDIIWFEWDDILKIYNGEDSND